MNLQDRDHFHLPIANDARVLVTGRTGSGKTTWAKQLIAAQLAAGRRIVCLDVKDTWSVKGQLVDGVAPGPLPYRWTAKQLALAPEVLKDPALALAIVPEVQRNAKSAARTFELIASVFEADPTPLLFVLEEVQLWADLCRTRLEEVATMDRDLGMAMVLVTQRAVGIPIDARSQLSEIVAFLQTEPADYDSLRDRTVLTDPDFAIRVQRLSEHDHLLWRAGASNETRIGNHPARAGGLAEAGVHRRGDPLHGRLAPRVGGGGAGEGLEGGLVDRQGGPVLQAGAEGLIAEPPPESPKPGRRAAPKAATPKRLSKRGGRRPRAAAV